VHTSAAAVSCQLDGEAAILNVQSGEYYGLDEVGAAVWRMMSESLWIGEIIQRLTSEYEVDPEQCEADLIGLIDKLAEHGLVDIDNAK
jgi:hypothetical protein